MSTSRLTRTVTALAAAGITAAAAVAFSPHAGATHGPTNEGSCTGGNLAITDSTVVAGGKRFSWTATCTGNRAYAETVTGRIQYPGTTTKTTVVQFAQSAQSQGTNAMSKHLDVPSISVACVEIDGRRRSASRLEETVTAAHPLCPR